MNHHDVIEWKISQLNNCSHSPIELPADMATYVDTHEDLQQELAFIESFYSQRPSDLPGPSENVRENFYAMLNEEANKDVK